MTMVRIVGRSEPSPRMKNRRIRERGCVILDQDGGAVRPLLVQSEVNVNLLRSHLGEALDRLPSVQGGAAGEPDSEPRRG